MMSKKEKLLYPFYVISHPSDGFYEVRHRGKGSVPLALLFVVLFGFSFSINRRFASFVVNSINPLSVNTRTEILAVVAAVLLFSIANWSVTCLMNGEGRFKDIVTVVGYSLLPLVLTFIPATILSWFIASDEESIYYIIKYVAILFFVILLLIGIMTIHNYTFGKTLITLILTFVSLLLIIFVAMLIYIIMDNLKDFIASIYTELILRA